MIQRTTHRVRRTVLVAIALTAVIGLAACSSDGKGSGVGSGTASGNGGGGGGNGGGGGGNGGNGGGNPARVDADGTTHIGAAELQAQIDALPLATLTAEQEAGLAHMREEEKLAYDVYTAMYDQWQLKPFSNISSAEQTHSDAMKVLLDRYGLDDPAAGNAAGVFTDPDLQALYDSLVAQGSESLVAALTVGATIEDLDIADLQSLGTTAPDIDLVYANLEKGSRNHLRAFTKQLVKNGATYTPAYISQAEYDAIIAGEMEQGMAG